MAPGDAAILELADTQPSSTCGKKRITLDGIAVLNRAFASPKQRVLYVSLLCCDLDVARVRALRLPPTVQRLDLSGNRIAQFEQVLSVLPASLTELGMRSAGITSVAIGEHTTQFPPALKALTLAYNPLDVQLAAALMDCLPESFECLDLAGSSHKNTLATRAVFARLPAGLVSFKYEINAFSLEAAEALALRLTCLRGLRTLQLHNCDMLPARAAVVIAALPDTLAELNLNGNLVHPHGASSALASRQLPQLTNLQLASTRMGAADLEDLA
ncbi:hypothetical protein H9P43_006298, partial [Blastocladiella emersonii ATCC 22665]